jgi:hypothetical protein
MDGLIRRCGSDKPTARRGFDDILQEFQACQFAILPRVDCDEIRAAVDDVLMWEMDAGTPRS